MRVTVALVLTLAWLFAGPARADTVHLKSGGKLDGRVVEETAAHVVIDTKFGRQTIERSRIARIERGLTPKQQIEKELAALAPDDADGRYALVERARKERLRALEQRILAEILRIDPNHKATNESLGRVLYRGRYVTPAERERLQKEDRAAEMKARGLVEHDGRFVTPEEKEKLEKGLVLRDGRWVSREEAMEQDGFVRVGDEWVKAMDAHVERVRADVEKVIGKPLFVHKSEHIAAYSDIEGMPEKLCDLLEKGWTLFAREFDVGRDLEWFGGRRADFFVFKSRFDYQKFVDWLGRERGMGERWASAARDVISIFRYQTWGLAATYLANRGDADVFHHMANQLGHVLLNTYRHEGRRLPPFFDDAYAALMEYTLLKRNLVFTVGTGRYERSIRDEEMAFFEDGNWILPLKKAMQTRSDTPLEHVVRRDFGDMTQMDVGKGMALFLRWRAMGGGKVRQFVDALRDAWPGGDLPPGHVRVLAAIRKAFHVAEGKDIPVVDQELRRFVMSWSDDEEGGGR